MNAAKQRIPWPDYVKGIAILLVVLGHLIIGLGLESDDVLRADGTVGSLNGWQFTVAWIYAFHMQVFFFISGLLAYHSSRKTAGGFIVAKLRTIAYPYFVWSVIQILLMLAMAGRTRHEVHWTDLITIVYRPVMQFWFLYALFFMFVIFALLRKLRLGPGGIFVFTLVLYGCDFFLLLPAVQANIAEPLWNVLHWVCSGMVFFGAGVYVSRWMIDGWSRVSTVWLAATAAVCCLLLTLGVRWITAIALHELVAGGEFWLGFLVAPVLAFLGIGMVCGLGGLAARSGVMDSLRLYGVASLEIYVAHTMAMAAVRIALGRVFHVEAVWLQLAAGMLAGVYFPLLIWWACRRVGFPYLFSWPER